MAGAFGTWQVPETASVSFDGETVEIPAGEFTPATAEEAAAVRHLASTSCSRPGEPSFVMATLSEGPTDSAAPAAEPEPLADAEAELAKAQADVAAAEQAAAPAAPTA